MRLRARKRPRGGATVPCTCSKKGPTRVLDTRRVNTCVVRVRVCTACGRRFRTKERASR
jgi:transcriptional regulator NrdR family protein